MKIKLRYTWSDAYYRIIRHTFCVFLLFSSSVEADGYLQIGGGYSWYKIQPNWDNLKIENLFNCNFEINLINSINEKNNEINFGLSFLQKTTKKLIWAIVMIQWRSHIL